MKKTKCFFCGELSSETRKMIESGNTDCKSPEEDRILICFDCIKKFKKGLEKESEKE